MKNKEKKAKRKFSFENDLSYRGPLSYRHLRIIAWVFFALSQIGMLLTLEGHFNDSFAQSSKLWVSLFSFIGSLMLPLLLLSTFSIILNAKDGYRKLIIMYAAAVLGIFLAFLYIYQHYLIGIFTEVMGDYNSGKAAVDSVLKLFCKNGFLSFNIFVDLLLCTLFTFFINYRPTRFFQNKKVIFFRFGALLPVLYEIGSFTLKILTLSGKMTLSPYFYPFLTTKSPVMFVTFIVLAFFLKNREKYFLKRGGNLEDYPRYLQTNSNSFHFAIFATISFIVAAFVDLIIFGILELIFAYNIAESQGIEVTKAVTLAASQINSLGIGKAIPMLFIAPFLLLFSYTRTYKNKIVDVIIPIGGIVLTLIIYIEGMYWVIVNLL